MSQIEIESMTYGPYGVGHLNGKTVLAPNAAPGDLIEADVVSEQRDYARARLTQIVRSSALRRPAPCAYLPRCGGCDWQHLDYPAQVSIKAKLLAADFHRALGLKLDPVGLIEPSPIEFGYRSRVRLKVGPGGTLGYYELESNKLVGIERCMVASCDLAPAKEFLRETRLRCVELEIVAQDKEQILIVHCTVAPSDSQIARASRVIKCDGRIAGIILKSSAKRIVLGDASISFEPEAGCQIIADADCFSQVNPAQNRKLVATVMELAAIEPAMPLLDLFCGSGNFSLPAARREASVTGVDADSLAIAAARQNALRMKLRDAQFIAMAAAETAQFLHRAKYQPSLVLLDPPRTGAAGLIESVARLRAPKIIYVSCDLATLLRDLGVLATYRYQVALVRGFDFFPNTHHIEAVAELLLT